MNLLPPSLLNNLNTLPAKLAIAGLVRHAERDAIPLGEFGNHVALNERGAASCHALTQRLSGDLIYLYSSPVMRCLQTAALLQSAAKFPSVIKSQLLGDPGVFITDVAIAHSFCQKQGPVQVAERLLSARQANPAGFCHSTLASAQALVKFMLKAAAGVGLSLFITHDSILSVVAGVFFPELTIQALWPQYLETLFFWLEHGHLHVRYRDQHRRVLWTH